MAINANQGSNRCHFCQSLPDLEFEPTTVRILSERCRSTWPPRKLDVEGYIQYVRQEIADKVTYIMTNNLK